MNITSLIKGIFSNDLYVQIWENRLKISNITSKEVYDEAPLIALKNDKKGQPVVEAIGNSVGAIGFDQVVEVINPFSHPRLLVNNFQLAEKVLMHAFRVLHENKVFVPAPRVIIQPMEKLEGGITEIEERVFRGLCLGAGAREIFVYVGEELNIDDINFDSFKKAKN